ncbi:MAG: hypothetical protein IRY91_00005, partial [Gemmatimonadaceae bacterium]|nr:hypothetical protein [Gemmatimonadaceae bacterium]
MDEERILIKAECDAIAQRVFAMARGGGETVVQIASWSNGELRWARNRASLASDRRDVTIEVRRIVPNIGGGNAVTNQIDDVSLEAAVREAERNAQVMRGAERPRPGMPPLPAAEWPKPVIWSDATNAVTPEMRGEIARLLIAPAEAKGFLSAGYLETRAANFFRVSSERPNGPFTPDDVPYVQWTQAQCSMTVRDQKGAGSG